MRADLVTNQQGCGADFRVEALVVVHQRDNAGEFVEAEFIVHDIVEPLGKRIRNRLRTRLSTLRIDREKGVNHERRDDDELRRA